jgi:hypothetical protein
MTGSTVPSGEPRYPIVASMLLSVFMVLVSCA